jgi:hypothetical protein
MVFNWLKTLYRQTQGLLSLAICIRYCMKRYRKLHEFSSLSLSLPLELYSPWSQGLTTNSSISCSTDFAHSVTSFLHKTSDFPIKRFSIGLREPLTWIFLCRRPLLYNGRWPHFHVTFLHTFLVIKSKLSTSNKLLIYKTILKPIWTYGIQLWGTVSTSNTEILERFQSKALLW